MERKDGTKLTGAAVATASLASTYTVTVYSPCLGTQEVTANVSGSSYSGTSGDFDTVMLYPISVNGQPSWEFAVYDFTAGSACFGVQRFRRETPSDDPVGPYVGTGGAAGAVA